ncbi:MAG: methyltransferase domain-containing protein [Defluviitaleaceae bacterium]|nr:methyltransferase domain-containing protein [Defluviitaleaceae bacterium]
MYKHFARVYDALMADTPYELWAGYIKKRIDDVSDTGTINSAREKTIVLDLACGTGNIAILLAREGFDVIGVDASEDMLAEASRKAFDENLSILFLMQDMRELNLYGTIDAAVCVCDGVSYILTNSDLMRAFERVRLFLNPGGIFIFDMNTEAKFINMHGKIFEDEHCEWKNNYDAKTKINEYHVAFFPPGEEPFEEIHRQRAFSPKTVGKLLAEAGFDSVEMFDGYSEKTLGSDSERAVFVARNAAILL